MKPRATLTVKVKKKRKGEIGIIMQNRGIVIPDKTKKRAEPKIITLTNYTINDDTEMTMMKNKEKASATPMCIPVELHGGGHVMALIDQGCSKTIIRSSA